MRKNKRREEETERIGELAKAVDKSRVIRTSATFSLSMKLLM